MNTKQIIAELRRSACEDDSAWQGGTLSVFSIACRWKCDMEFLMDMPSDDLRTFYLLVAEAMESE